MWPSTSLTVLVLTRDGPFPLLGLPLAVQALLDLFGSVWAQQLSQWPWLLCAILASSLRSTATHCSVCTCRHIILTLQPSEHVNEPHSIEAKGIMQCRCNGFLSG